MKLSDLINFTGNSFSVNPTILRKFGTKQGVFLCRIIWWQRGPDEWIEKDIATIHYETGMTPFEQRSARSALISLGIIEEEHKRLEHKLCFRIVASALEMELDSLDGYSPNEETSLPQVKKLDSGNSGNLTSTVEVHKKVLKKVHSLDGKEKDKKSDHQKFIDEWDVAYKEFFHRKYQFDQADFATAKKIVASPHLRDSAIPLALKAWKIAKKPMTKNFNCNIACTIKGLLSRWNEIGQEIDISEGNGKTNEDEKFINKF